MKFYLICISLLLSLNTQAQAEAVEHSDSALETNGIKVEYFESSKKGIIRPSGCSQCLLEFYNFKKDIKIIKNGKSIQLPEFMNDYWNAKYPTIFIDLKTNEVKRVNY